VLFRALQHSVAYIVDNSAYILLQYRGEDDAELQMRIADLSAFLAGLSLLCAPLPTRASPSETGRPAASDTATVCDGIVLDSSRKRALPIRFRMPSTPVASPMPVIFFSHGLGGSIDGGTAWGAAWAKAGFAVIHVQHPGSDRAIWIDQPTPEARREALKAGAAPQQLLARVADIRFVMDLIGTSQNIGACSFSKLDPKQIGAAGHSLGAHTMLALAGQHYEVMGTTRSFSDPRIKAFLILSGSPPQNDPAKAAAAFGTISRPLLTITGTRDAVPFQPNVSPVTRQAIFAGLPAGNKWQLVLEGADHITFNGADLMRSRTSNDDRIWSIVESITTQFFLAKVLGQAEAEAALTPTGAAALLGPRDTFQTK
jgi:predicted dienelactone hydrolase